MIYRSNLTAPDLTPCFAHLHSRVQPQSMGHDVPSDWADKADDDPVFGIYKRCGMWTHDEAAILYNVVHSWGGGTWLDIGAHTGWTAAHMAMGHADVISIEPMLWNEGWRARFMTNTGGLVMPWAGRSDQFFAQLAGQPDPTFDGIVIDGDHMPVCVDQDVRNSHDRLKPHGVILMHDFIGAWSQGIWLLEQGYKCHVFLTPHLVGCFWRCDWAPPVHVPDPAINWQEIKTNHMRGFPWERATADV